MSTSPDLVVTNAVVHTMDTARPVVHAFAVRDGIFTAVGDRDARDLAGPGTEVLDLRGAAVVPGMSDAHNHPLPAGMAALHELTFAPSAPVTDIVAAVGLWIDAHPGDGWVIGSSWGTSLFGELSDGAALRALDAVSGSRPVLLTDDSHHNQWVNTAGLQIAGVLDAAVADDRGLVVRDGSDRPTGLLVEQAGSRVAQLARVGENPTADELATAYAHSIRILNALGITSFQDAAANVASLTGLTRLDDAGDLSAWAVSSLLVNDNIMGNTVVGEDLLALRDDFRTPHHRVTFGKIFLDGVPTSYTGSFVDPYLPTHEHGSHWHGSTTMDLEELTRWFFRLGELGLGAKVHCTGDGSVRMTLDATENLRRAGDRTTIVQVAHATYVHPDDIHRFAELDVVVEISPMIWFPSLIADTLDKYLPLPLATRMYPVRDLLDAGATVAAGSDWPVAEPPNPWYGTYGLLTRKDPTGERPGALWPAQRIGLDEAMATYTTGAAAALGLSDVTGRIAPGLSAEFVVASADPWAVPTEELKSITTSETWFAGRRVFERG